MVVKALSLVAYYGDLLVNLILCSKYNDEAHTSKFDSGRLTWILLGFIIFGRVVSILFFLFSFGLKGIPNVQRPHIRHIAWQRFTSKIFTLCSLLLFTNPIRLDFIARGWLDPDPPVEKNKRGERKLNAKKQAAFEAKWKIEMRHEVTKVLVFQMAIQALFSSLPCFSVHMHFMSRNGVQSATTIIGAIFSTLDIAFTSVRAGKFVIDLMTADVSGRDVMQFGNVRDLASSMWMGIPVVLTLVTHIMSVGFFSSKEDIGVAGIVFFPLVYVEILIFILPWLIKEGDQCCCHIERCRTRFLIMLQVLTSIISISLALSWFSSLDTLLSPPAEVVTTTATNLTIATTFSDTTSTFPVTTQPVDIDTFPANTSNTTYPSTAPTIAVTTFSANTSNTASPSIALPTAVTTFSATTTTTDGPTAESLNAAIITTWSPPPSYFTYKKEGKALLIFTGVLQILTFVFYVQVIIRPSMWLTLCKRIGTAVCKPPLEEGATKY